MKYSFVALILSLYIWHFYLKSGKSLIDPSRLNFSYDYIIGDVCLNGRLWRVSLVPFSVGSGTAGGVLASRLSADPEISVLLLEAGGEPPYHAKVPGAVPFLQQTEIDWQYKTERQEWACLGLHDQAKS